MASVGSRMVSKLLGTQRMPRPFCVRYASYNQPLSGNDMPRPGGIASMMRLPVQETSAGLDVCFVGVPFDIGTSHKNGSRFGPRQIRCESALMRPVNVATGLWFNDFWNCLMDDAPIFDQGFARIYSVQSPGAAPFESLQVADVGDVPCSMFDIREACRQIREDFRNLTKDGCKTMAIGGDHTISYPILQAIKEKYGPVGLVHIDAHPDTADIQIGSKLAHGTPFYRAFEEGCLDPARVVQIGLRGPAPDLYPYKWGADQGFRIVLASDCWHKSLTPLMSEVRDQMGDRPVYLTFDIDGIDPAFAPGTGFPEIAGLTSIQALEIIRGCRGLNIVGCDLVEVSPGYDIGGMTSVLAANLLFEMLCVLPGVKYY